MGSLGWVNPEGCSEEDRKRQDSKSQGGQEGERWHEKCFFFFFLVGMGISVLPGVEAGGSADQSHPRQHSQLDACLR